jgi:hypothetical protein
MSTATQTYTVEIACDTEEAEQFAAWLRDQGHEAKVGRSTGTYINGQRDAETDEIAGRLWSEYCAA